MLVAPTVLHLGGNMKNRSSPQEQGAGRSCDGGIRFASQYTTYHDMSNPSVGQPASASKAMDFLVVDGIMVALSSRGLHGAGPHHVTPRGAMDRVSLASLLQLHARLL